VFVFTKYSGLVHQPAGNLERVIAVAYRKREREKYSPVLLEIVSFLAESHFLGSFRPAAATPISYLNLKSCGIQLPLRSAGV
jgi:hypothetical protein